MYAGRERMKKSLAFLIALLMIMSLVALTGCSSNKPAADAEENSPESVAERKQPADESAAQEELRVGMECNYPPYNWTQTDDSNDAVALPNGGFAGGYDVEIAKTIAKGLGKKLVIVKTEWDGLIPALTSGKVDAVIAGMSPTKDRKVSVDFTDKYYTSDLVVVVKKDGAYAGAKSLADLSGAKITGQLNTFHYVVIPQIPDVKQQTAMESFPAMIVALESGKIDGYISERPGALSAMQANPDLAFVDFEEGKGFEVTPDDVAISVAVEKGQDELVGKINEILAGISEEQRQELMEQAVLNQPIQG